MRNKRLTTGNRPRVALAARGLTPAPRPLTPGKRRGTVLIMVIGVLAILFVMGSTLMIVARFERGVAETKDESQQFKAVALMITEPILAQLREDIVGTDGEPYNSGWPAPLGNGDPSLIEDNADFSGLITPTPNRRNGDLLLSSSEPFFNGANWQWYSSSWVLDAVPLGTTYTNTPVNIGPTYGPKYDADGDGLSDSGDSGGLASLSAMFGGGYWLEFRVVPHGGMVLIDRLTHPSLLAQVIHPQDKDASNTLYQSNPALLWTNNPPLQIDIATDEVAVRRRFSLPREKQRTTTPASTYEYLENLLPITLAFAPPTGTSTSYPHWWPFDDKVLPADATAWPAQFEPGSPVGANNFGPGLTETGYDSTQDVYNRRHLMTTASSDDILRPRRDEVKLQTLLPLFHEVLNPAADPLSDSGTPPVYLDYGRDSTGALQFNGTGLRTAFSLRDVLVEPSTNQAFDSLGNSLPYGMHASYRRAVQLTAYYLAMIQHTTVPLAEQLRTAAQLAINTIDFADFDDPDGDLSDNNTPSVFYWPPTGAPQVQVVGIEKQPYITEAYVKIAYKPLAPANTDWDAATPEYLCAVELYNPYDVAIDLFAQGYALRIMNSSGTPVPSTPPNTISFPSGSIIQPFSYAVFANTNIDPATGLPLGIAAGNSYGSFTVLPWPATMYIPPEGSVQLIRNNVFITTTNTVNTSAEIVVDWIRPDGLGAPASNWAKPAVTISTPTPQPSDDKYVDDPDPSNLTPNACAPTPPFIIRHPGQRVTGVSNGVPVASDRLVRDSSLQRHKEFPGKLPIFWHATISRQILFPLPEDESRIVSDPNCEAALTDVDGANRPSQHNLLGTNYDAVNVIWTKNQEWVDREFKGIPIVVTPNNTLLTTAFPAKIAIAPLPIMIGPARFPESDHNYLSNYRNEWTYSLVGIRNSISVTFDAATDTGTDQVYIMDGLGNQILGSPFQGTQLASQTKQISGSTIRIVMDGNAGGSWGFKVTDIVGSDGSRNYLAFPTTGSLLLVSRYAHQPANAALGFTADVPGSVAATLVPAGVAGRVAVELNLANLPGQMQLLDNGHLPIIDGKVYDAGGTLLTAGQTCTDLIETQGRLDGPWGQLIYDYFTALPLEELVEPRDLTFLVLTPPPPNPVRLTALPDDQYSYAYRVLFPGYPLNGRAVGSNTVGPMVKGRINVNFAPWWVLDGLPMTSHSPSLPVAELQYNYLDPVTLPTPPPTPLPVPVDYQRRPGLLFSTMSTDENSIAQNGLQGGYSRPPNTNPPLDLPSSSPTMSKAIVGYRENRNVDSVILVNNLPSQHPPGLLTVGQLAEVLIRTPVTVATAQNTGAPNTVQNTTVSLTLNTLKDYSYNVDATDIYTMEKPFAYLGYLQLVAPMVRLQDWVTVKNHVFTVYTTIRTTTSPEINMRTQVTVDRTRCLYTKDLPARIAEIEPIGYYNAIDD